MEAGHDRDGQVVEDRAEWGVGIVPGWSGAPLWALAPSPGGSLACARARQMGSRSGSVSYFG